MPTVNQALVLAGFRDIHSIVTTFDSGGDTGRIRTDERGGVLAFSDYWRSLMSLWPDCVQKKAWGEMLKFRDGRGRNFGNLFFQFMAEKSGDLSKVDSYFSKLIGANLCGEVIPVALSPSDLCFVTKSGKNYRGESWLDELRMSRDKVVRVWLEPKIKANPEVLDSMLKSDVIIVCPGSMYGSVISNFLPTGMAAAFSKSRAKKILMTNIMSVANENFGYSQSDYIEVFSKYLGRRDIFDFVLMADLSKLNTRALKKIKDLYEMENSSFIKMDDKCRVKTIMADMAKVEEVNFRLRHSATKMAEVFRTLVC